MLLRVAGNPRDVAGHRQRVTRAALLAAALLAAGCSRPPARLVLITIDSLRADHVGPRREGASLTPALDALARDGVSYDDAIANCTVTRCSHASLLTGLYPERHGLLDNSSPLGDVVALPALLHAAGFVTGAVISSLPLKGLLPGWDSLHEGFDAAEAVRTQYRVKRPEQTTQVAARFLQERESDRFFLWVHYFPPHGPYTPPEAFLPAGAPAPDERLAVSAQNYDKGRIPAYQALPEVFEAAEYRRRYAGHVRYVDHFVGRFLNRLREAGLYEDALIVATSDHGESLGEHGWYFVHGNLAYEEQARVPLIVKWPRARHAGRRVSAGVELVDVAPTLLKSLGGPAHEMDGWPLPDPMGSRENPRSRHAQSNDAEVVAVWDGPWKLLWKRGRTTYTDPGHPALELFRLDQDPGETRDLASSQPARVKTLQVELRRRYGRVPVSPSAPAPETREALRALGYVE